MKPDTSSTLTMEEEDVDMSGRASPAFITVENEKGVLEHVQINLDDFEEEEKQDASYFNFGGFGGPISNNDTLHSGLDGSVPNTKSIKAYKKNIRKRIVSKTGECNTQLFRVNKKKTRLMKDVFITILDLKWRYTLLMFLTSFMLSWLIFGVIWWLIAYVHGDYLEENMAKMEAGEFIPCVLANINFASAFLFSVETQHTIGYGSRQTTEECPEAIIMQCIQSVVGVIIQACMAGVVFAKLARPKKRRNTVVFSKNAVISQRNGRLLLMFRIGNMRSSHLIQAQVRAQLVHKVVTDEGENIYFYQQELKVGTQLDGSEDRALMLWPMTAVHLIDEESPFWKMSPKDILSTNFEIIVTLDSVIESTGNTTQARSSYLPNEILWGFRFDNLISYAQKQNVYAIDCSSINRIIPDNTPRVAASMLSETRQQKKSTLSTMSFNGTLSPYHNGGGGGSRMHLNDMRKQSLINNKFQQLLPVLVPGDNGVYKRFSITSASATPITEETSVNVSDNAQEHPEHINNGDDSLVNGALDKTKTI